MDLIPMRFDLDEFFSDFPKKGQNNMKTDIYELDGIYHLDMDIPGFKKENVKITCDDGYLTITATNETKEEEKKANYIHKERHYGKVSRSFYVGNIPTNEIKANFDNGLLKVTFPKNSTTASKTTIDIE
ncbi:MAG: Hsp20/alpha crystallin family protein [bacterium]|nr:Hsp20/alpha crystallin family protein [bacterium]